MSRIEAGKKRATRPFVEIVDDHLEAHGALIGLWEDLNKDGHPVPVWFDWPQVEGDAVMLACWEHGVIPGLLQTVAYTSVLLRGNQEAIDLRLRRQAILTRDDGTPPTLFVLLLDEHALYRRVGPVETMKEQLEHLLTMGMLPNITIQVVLASGEHTGNSGDFMIATMEDRSEVAYVETAIRGIATDNPTDLATLARTLIELRAQALTENMSREVIRKAIEKWT
ncbi:DUF5753 domain-containing protein [Spirillospora sp. CA-108201]